jgi:phytoene desaturase
MLKTVTIIGSGFAGLSAAATLGKAGYKVRVVEKNEHIGGRARKFQAEGFTFDMGPSWYWMPEVFENFYSKFDHTASDFYELKRLSPSYRVYFSDTDKIDVPASLPELYNLFESIEKGSADKLKKFLSEAQYKYEVGMNDFVWKPSLSITEFFDWRIVKSLFQLQMFSSISSQIRSQFKNPYLRNILEFPVLFLGAKPQNTPALYSLMNYADLSLGTWYPMGGMHKIIEAMAKICKEQNVEFVQSSPVTSIDLSQSRISTICEKQSFKDDYCIASADYHHVDRHLLDEKYSNYSEKYWDKRAMAPSSLLFYLGVDKKVPELKHHNLFFDADFDNHADDIYKYKRWPEDPLFYVCSTSKTDASVAPENKENLFILIPLAPDLKGDQSNFDRQFDKVIQRLEKTTGTDIRSHIIYKRQFTTQDFASEYNSFKGNAYGLANTLMQTAFLKPKIQNKKHDCLYYTGQLTVPGPGVPPSIISGQVVADHIIRRNG